MRFFACALVIALAGCGTSKEEVEKQSRDQLATRFIDTDNAQTPLKEKCRMARELAIAYDDGRPEDVYAANHWAMKREAYCSSAPDHEKMKEAEAELADWKNGHDEDYGQNRCAQYSLVAMAYREARNGPAYNEWRMKTRDYCESKGWRWDV